MNTVSLYDLSRFRKHYCYKLNGCDVCPISVHKNKHSIACTTFLTDYPEEASEIIYNWCKEHPLKTRLSEFKKLFPNGWFDNEDGLPIKREKRLPHCF